MTPRFAEARQGKGPLGPRTVRSAFLLIGAGIAYSQYFYAPQVRLEPARVAAAQTVTPIRRVPDASRTYNAVMLASRRG